MESGTIPSAETGRRLIALSQADVCDISLIDCRGRKRPRNDQRLFGGAFLYTRALQGGQGSDRPAISPLRHGRAMTPPLKERL